MKVKELIKKLEEYNPECEVSILITSGDFENSFDFGFTFFPGLKGRIDSQSLFLSLEVDLDYALVQRCDKDE